MPFDNCDFLFVHSMLMKGTILLFSIQDDSEKINEERKQEIAKQATVNPELLRCENFPQCLHFSEINLNI